MSPEAAPRLHPVDLAHEVPRSQRGTPRMASGETARRILENVAALPAPYGTRVEIEDGIGIIRVETRRTDGS